MHERAGRRARGQQRASQGRWLELELLVTRHCTAPLTLGLPEQRWRPLTLDKQQQTCWARGLAGVGLSFREIFANPELGASLEISEQQQSVVIGQEMRQRGSGLRLPLPVVFIPATISEAARLKTSLVWSSKIMSLLPDYCRV